MKFRKRYFISVRTGCLGNSCNVAANFHARINSKFVIKLPWEKSKNHQL